jgi:uncharacterized membrane protein
MTETAAPHHDDRSWLDHLRHSRRHARKGKVPSAATPEKLPLGPWLADKVASTMGSWGFIIAQSTFLAVWIVGNVVGWFSYDPFPFILLNLMLSFQAAYAAPFIMMSQNRQSEIDRARAIEDFHINCKAELEIEQLHAKVDLMREQEIARLQRIIEDLVIRLDDKLTKRE